MKAFVFLVSSFLFLNLAHADGLAQMPQDIIQEVQAEYFGVAHGYVVSGEWTCTSGESSAKLNDFSSKFQNALAPVINKYSQDALTRLFDRFDKEIPNWSTSGIIDRANFNKVFLINDSQMRLSQPCSGGSFRNTIYLVPGTITIEVTPAGAALLDLTLPIGAGVEPTILGLGNALKTIKLIPSQKKVLKSFFDAAKRFWDSLQENQARVARGERPKPVTHRDFMSQASLLIAYYRFLTDSFDEAAQLSSEYYGIDRMNVAAVQTIKVAIGNLVEAYGLESDITQRQVADYGRVLSDLLINQLAPLVDENNKQNLVRPVIIQLAKMIAISEVQGDTLTQDEVLKFKFLWENRDFASLMAGLLTATDLKLNGLILNINSLAYKIGLATNVTIDVLDKEDVDRLRNQPKPPVK